MVTHPSGQVHVSLRAHQWDCSVGCDGYAVVPARPRLPLHGIGPGDERGHQLPPILDSIAWVQLVDLQSPFPAHSYDPPVLRVGADLRDGERYLDGGHQLESWLAFGRDLQQIYPIKS